MGAEKRPGILATTASLVALPFRVVIGGVLTVLNLILDAFERGFSAIGNAAKGAYLRGDPKRESSWRSLTGKISFGGTYAVLAVLLLFMLFPFYWVVVTAFKTQEQLRTSESVFWPSPWTFTHFRYMLTETDYPTWFGNTVQVAVVSLSLIHI